MIKRHLLNSMRKIFRTQLLCWMTGLNNFVNFLGKHWAGSLVVVLFLCAHYQNHRNCKRLNNYSASEIFFSTGKKIRSNWITFQAGFFSEIWMLASTCKFEEIYMELNCTTKDLDFCLKVLEIIYFQTLNRSYTLLRYFVKSVTFFANINIFSKIISYKSLIHKIWIIYHKDVPDTSSEYYLIAFSEKT